MKQIKNDDASYSDPESEGDGWQNNDHLEALNSPCGAAWLLAVDKESYDSNKVCFHPL